MSTDAAPIEEGEAERLRDAVAEGSVDDVRAAWSTSAADAMTEKLRKAPLALAANLGHAAVVSALIGARRLCTRHCARLTRRRVRADLGCKDHAPHAPHWTALMHASFNGHDAVVEALLKNAPADAQLDADGMLPIHLACLNGHTGCATLLLDAAPATVGVTDHLGRTALICAASGGWAALCALLAERGAKLDEASSDGCTALHWAVIAHRPLAVEALVALGCSVHVADADGKTPLDHARERQGKDPVLRHVATYLEGCEANPVMQKPAWVVHAERGPADDKVEVAAATGTPAPATSDIWEEEDAEPPPVASSAPAPAKEPVEAEGGVMDLDGDLDALD